MTPDAARATLTDAAADELKKLFTQFFNSADGGVKDADAHFEQGVRVLANVTPRAIQIATKVFSE